MTVNVNAGILEVRNSASLGAAPNITVTSATFQLDPALSYPSGVATVGPMFFGDQNTTTTLKNNSTLRNGASGNNVAVPITLFGNVAVDNAATTNITVPTGGETIFAQAFKNTTAAPTGAASQINITGAGIVMLNGNSSIPLAYTGSWNINHGSVGNVTGQTILTAFDSLGVTNTGFAAPVTLTSGYLTDTASDSAHAVPNPITLNGGVLNALANFNSTTRTNAYFSGSINLQSIGGSTIDMSNSAIGDLSGAVCNINLTGPISGNGTLFITAPTTNLQSPGVVTLSNISSATPNTQSGNLIVQYNAALSATTSTGNSNPLGAANISLAGGELLLNHAGAGSNGTITAFANNNITLRGYANGNLATAPTHDGTITLDNAGSANTGNTITLGSLTFDATGTSATQTLAIQNAAGANYKAQFNGLATLNGTATITTGTNPADVILNNKITGPGNLIKAGNNTLTLSGVSSNYTGATTVNAGTLIFNATHQIASLTVNTTSHAVVSSGGNKFLQAGTLAINGTGALDLTDEDAILTNTPIGTVQTYIQSAYNNGPWTGTGLTSTSAQSTAASAHKTALGFATASSINASSFDGQPLTTGSTVLIRYTYSGDANLDGLVNLLDLNALATNFGTPSSTWSQGDFNYDGTVNVMDFNLLASNFGNVLAAPPVSSLPLALGALVPEPASALFIALPLLMMRRRKSNQ
jgi:autotransporter-associated beta strand protein